MCMLPELHSESREENSYLLPWADDTILTWAVKSALPHATSLRKRRLPENLAKGGEVKGLKD